MASSFFLVLLAAAFCPGLCPAANLAVEASLVARFDEGVGVDRPNGVAFQRSGGNIIRDGVSGGALRLSSGEYLTIDADRVISPAGGTVMFWVRPHWSYYERSGENLLSHTFLSFSWADNGYFVLSDGWWEPLGSPYTYFIANVNNRIAVNPKVRYRENQWTHVAVAWTTGRDGNLGIYVDGELIEERTAPVPESNPSGKLYIGCDKGTSLAGGPRWADSDFDELVILGHAASKAEIQRRLDGQDPEWRERKFDWMKPVLAQPYRPKRDDAGRPVELRAVFDGGPGKWGTERKARALIARIKRAGFNVFIPCVWMGDGTRYPSPAAPPAKYKAAGDPLASLIRIAHEEGVEVHPWFAVSYRGRDFLPKFRDPETPSEAFEMHRPGFRDFIVKMILDVVERYDVDGINLDFIRTQGVTRSRFVAERYREATGRDLETDGRSFDARGCMEPHLQRFLDSAVEDVVRRVSEGVRSRRPRVILSVDGQPIPSMLCPSQEGRQEAAWANRGMVDLIFSMNYEQVPDTDALDLVRGELMEPEKLVLLLGSADGPDAKPHSRDARLVAGLVGVARRKWPRGIGIYPYFAMSDEQLRLLVEGPFAERALPRPFSAGPSPIRRD